MPFDLEDYKKWAEIEKNNNRQPSIHQYLRHLIYTEANAEPKHIGEKPSSTSWRDIDPYDLSSSY